MIRRIRHEGERIRMDLADRLERKNCWGRDRE
jgi:hypothetical protein